MGKRLEGLQRMLVIVNKLKESHSYITVEELERYVTLRMEERGYTGVNLRTLQRDLQDIASLFGIRIKHEHGGYHIIEEDEQEWNRYEELLLNFDLLNALEGDSTLASYVLPEHHRPQHSEWLASLIGAIKRSHPVEFQYVLVRHDDQQVKKKVLPHFLKESNQRWYLLAYEGDTLKTFGVDRIRDLHVLDNEHFQRDTSIDVQALFRDCYGIWDQTDIPVEDIELRYDALDGKFLKSVPLHHSQVILSDTSEEFRIALHLRITNDFVMELLSRSCSLEVIRPLHLRERVRHIYEAALRRNA
ncbi:MAG TPA: WYL domain-containing protein [Candidatus Bacteroides merdipullorum]|uniref:WYL domain-containing protein n=1 Tax=Candidatus Bacteroides merdipullorum TaxID=2838474 RepID=A0A9D2CWS4_9BACE|nr:WYL domain-containing protein [Candidatus Bacteroides merdipullorum]